MKKTIKKLFSLLGYEIKKIDPFPNSVAKIGSNQRTVGDMEKLIEDLKFRGLNCEAIIDIGANRTGWSTMAKGIFPDARFCLIEPQVELEDYLKTFCKHTKNSVYFIAGAGPKKEQKTLTIWDDFEGSSFLPKENDLLKSEGKQRAIDMISVDELLETGKFEIPQLVKLDIQGFEIEALKGATTLFGKTEVFILEVSMFPFSDNMPVLADVINFMLQHDYVAYDFPGFLRRPLDGALGQCDICFVKRNGFLRLNNNW